MQHCILGGTDETLPAITCSKLTIETLEGILDDTNFYCNDTNWCPLCNQLAKLLNMRKNNVSRKKIKSFEKTFMF